MLSKLALLLAVWLPERVLEEPPALMDSASALCGQWPTGFCHFHAHWPWCHDGLTRYAILALTTQKEQTIGKVVLGRLSLEKPVQTTTSFSASPFKNISVVHNRGARNSITKIDMAKAEGWTQTAAVPSGEKQSITPHTKPLSTL